MGLTLRLAWEDQCDRDESPGLLRSIAREKTVNGASPSYVPRSVGEVGWMRQTSVDLCGLVALVGKPLRAVSQGGPREFSKQKTCFCVFAGFVQAESGRAQETSFLARFLSVYRAAMECSAHHAVIANG